MGVMGVSVLELTVKFWGSEQTAENGRTLLGDMICE